MPKRFPLHLGKIVVAAFLAGTIGCREREVSSPTEYPRRPIKLIVPFGAGGGSDTFGRIIQNAIEANGLLSQPLVIVNVPGAGGTIGSRRVKNALPDGYTLLLLHEGILTAQHSGQALYGPEAFTPIAGTGDATQVIAVADISEFGDLPSLMNAAEKHPDTLVFSANIGAPSHFAGLMLESKQPGAAFRYTQNGGGAKRFAALQGGHVDVSAFSIAEYVQFQKSGMRALAFLGNERHSEFPQLQTAAEQGYDVISQNMQFWWAPLGTPPERTAVVAQAVSQAMQTPKVRQRLAEMKMATTTLTGEALQREIDRRRSRIAAVATSDLPPLPNFPAIAFGTLVGLAILAGVRASKRPTNQRNANAQDRDQYAPGRLFAVSTLTLLYISSFQFGWLSFVPATALYALLCGGTLAWPLIQSKQISAPRAAATIGAVAILMSIAMHFLFTEILVVDLP